MNLTSHYSSSKWRAKALKTGAVMFVIQRFLNIVCYKFFLNCGFSGCLNWRLHSLRNCVILPLIVVAQPIMMAAATDQYSDEAPQIVVTPQHNAFLAYGDIRFTDASRCNVSNPKARRAIVDRISSVEKESDFVLITGDVVYHGDDSSDWKIFEQETKSLREARLRLFPVLGNHDVHGRSGKDNFVEHFDELKPYPQLKKHLWYSIDYGNTRLLLLDSQTSYEPGTPQGLWLREQLKSVTEDLEFLIVVLHHPLITHPKRGFRLATCHGQPPIPAVPHDVENAEKWLREVLENFSRTHPYIRLLTISGHNHNYERYSIEHATYIVTAGGGATPYRIRRTPQDAYREPGATFHYCKIMIKEHRMKVEMYKLRWKSQDEPDWSVKDSFEIVSPAGEVSATHSGSINKLPQH